MHLRLGAQDESLLDHGAAASLILTEAPGCRLASASHSCIGNARTCSPIRRVPSSDPHLPRCSCYNLAPMGARGARGAV
eukprot:350445-Chlamydomonas_euryale.AAC.2